MLLNENIYIDYIGYVFLNTHSNVEYKILKSKHNSKCIIQWHNSLLQIEEAIISYSQIELFIKSDIWIFTKRTQLKMRKLILEKK